MICKLDAELTIATAAKVKSDLLQAIAGGGPFELDTRQVTEVDAAGLQLLLAAFKSAVGAKIPVRFPAESRSPAVTAGLALLGFTGADAPSEDVLHG